MQQPRFYTLKEGESIKEAKHRWMSFCLYDLSRKMNSKMIPTSEFIKTAVQVMERFPENVIWTFFEEAPAKFKYFPKPIEIKEGLWEIDRAIAKTQAVNKPIAKAPAAERWPWPNSIIGLIMGIDDPRGLSPFGLRSLRITEDEAHYLYTRWKEKDWDNEWAREIIAKAKTTVNFSKL